VTHLGRWLSALVDNELDEVERDRILNHLAGCAPCRVEANELRAIKRRMVALGQSAADVVMPGPAVQLARLSGNRPGRLAYLAPRLTGASHLRGWWPRAGGPGLLAAGGGAGVVVIALGLSAFLLGGHRAAPAPRVTPAVDAYWLQHSYDIGQVPAATGVKPGSSPLPTAGAGASHRQISHRAGRPAVSPGGPSALPSASASATPQPAVSHRRS
jgi:anti-sigma factor RsiW